MRNWINTFAILVALITTSCAFQNPMVRKIDSNYVHIKLEYQINVCNLFIAKCSDHETKDTGSAVIIANNKVEDKTYILSAAHVCNAGPEASEIPPFIKVRTSKEKMVLFDIDGKETEGKVLAVDKNIDLCLIEAPYLNRMPIVISNRSPKRNDYISTVGSPWGVRTHKDNDQENDNQPFIFEGRFQGYVSREIEDDKKIEDAVYIIDAMPGQSGSPILDINGRLVGIVSRTIMPNMKIALSPTLKQIKEFLDTYMP
jgi:S1-C subfamily serine protease